MTWAFHIYFVVYVLFAFLGTFLDYTEKKHRLSFLACTALATLVMAYLLLAYQYPSLLPPPMKQTAPILFAGALCWDVRSALDDVKDELLLDKELTILEKYAVLTLALMLCVPAWILAGGVSFGLFAAK